MDMGNMKRILFIVAAILLVSCGNKDLEVFSVYYVPVGTNYGYAQRPDAIIEHGLHTTISSYEIGEIFKIHKSKADYVHSDSRIVIVNERNGEMAIIDHSMHVNFPTPSTANCSDCRTINYNGSYCYNPDISYEIDDEYLSQIISEIEHQLKKENPAHRYFKENK
ncbi:MAG: hypothetical protein HZC51_10620 [Nitrospirae bacterium]|nr:hypothetical protein [Nitrospirota bacterium]